MCFPDGNLLEQFLRELKSKNIKNKLITKFEVLNFEKVILYIMLKLIFLKLKTKILIENIENNYKNTDSLT